MRILSNLLVSAVSADLWKGETLTSPEIVYSEFVSQDLSYWCVNSYLLSSPTFPVALRSASSSETTFVLHSVSLQTFSSEDWICCFIMAVVDRVFLDMKPEMCFCRDVFSTSEGGERGP